MRMPLYRRIEPDVKLLEYECRTCLEAERDRRGHGTQ